VHGRHRKGGQGAAPLASRALSCLDTQIWQFQALLYRFMYSSIEVRYLPTFTPSALHFRVTEEFQNPPYVLCNMI